MKSVYERPLMHVEMFVANNAVSTCTVEGGIDYTFDCMRGPTTETKNVISSQIVGVSATCSLNIGYASGIYTARDYYNSKQHSNNNSRATWSNGNGYLQVSYSGAEGILYTDGDANTDGRVWSVEQGYVKHSANGGGTHHMVAPVVDTRYINASW